MLFALSLSSISVFFLSHSVRWHSPLFKCVYSSICLCSRPPFLSLTLIFKLFCPSFVLLLISLSSFPYHWLSVSFDLTSLHCLTARPMRGADLMICIDPVSRPCLSNCLSGRLNSRILPTSNTRLTGRKLHSRFDSDFFFMYRLQIISLLVQRLHIFCEHVSIYTRAVK